VREEFIHVSRWWSLIYTCDRWWQTASNNLQTIVKVQTNKYRETCVGILASQHCCAQLLCDQYRSKFPLLWCGIIDKSQTV